MRRIIILAVILTALPFTVRAGDYDPFGSSQVCIYVRSGNNQMPKMSFVDTGLVVIGTNLKIIAPSGRVWELVEDSVPTTRKWWIEKGWGYWGLDTTGWTPILTPRIVEEDSARIPHPDAMMDSMHYWEKYWPDTIGAPTVLPCDTGRVVEVWEPTRNTSGWLRINVQNHIIEQRHRYRITNCRDSVVYQYRIYFSCDFTKGTFEVVYLDWGENQFPGWYCKIPIDTITVCDSLEIGE